VGGISPGTTNVLAAYAADKFDKVHEIRIRHGYRVLEKPAQKTYATWSPEISWACTAKPIVFENGKLREVPPFGGEESYTFPDPVGQCTVAFMLFAHEEVVTLPRFIGKGLKYVDLKSAHIEPVQKALYQLGFLGTKAVRVKDVEVVPRDVLLKVLPKTLSSEDVEKVDRVEMLGKAGKKTNYMLYVKGPTFKQVQKKLLGVNCVSYLTGTSAAVFTDMLGKREVETKGAFPPECLEPTAREIFIKRLSEKDIEVYEHVERPLS
jgi:saccharopine dehydrogenase-like NADP-dependent oxidoreductase